MANIAITNYCNLKCPYCFAEDMIKEDNKTMSVENYIKVLKYLTERSDVKHIGILGGEPTLHPQFKDILIESNHCSEVTHTSFTLFTNGINLEQYLSYIGDNITVLINCNKDLNIAQRNDFFSTINHCADLGWFKGKQKATCGCNLFVEEYEYKYIWELVDIFSLQTLRCSVTSPGGKYTQWRCQKDEYFKRMKPIFINFCKEAQKRRVTLNLDCGHIPSCYFTENELELIKEVTNQCCYVVDIGCNPVMDITPDLKIVPCFGSYEHAIPLDFSKNWYGVMRYINYNCNYPKAIHNTQYPCANCSKLTDFQCQGGCLAFSSPI